MWLTFASPLLNSIWSKNVPVLNHTLHQFWNSSEFWLEMAQIILYVLQERIKEN